jgi:hypothetical protein
VYVVCDNSVLRVEPVPAPDARDLVTFRFRVRDCRPCPLRDKCTKSTNLTD